MEGPAGPGIVEAPSGLTPLELRAAEEARRSIVDHLGKNPVLRMDDLVEMRDLRPRLEKEIRLPGDSRGARNKVYFFSIDGTLRGNRLTHCLMAGSCMMIQAPSFEQANKLAKDGLQDTIDIAKQFFEELARSLVVASPYDVSHLTVDVGGHKAGQQAPDLATDPKLKAMLLHKLGGKTWRW